MVNKLFMKVKDFCAHLVVILDIQNSSAHTKSRLTLQNLHQAMEYVPNQRQRRLDQMRNGKCSSSRENTWQVTQIVPIKWKLPKWTIDQVSMLKSIQQRQVSSSLPHIVFLLQVKKMFLPLPITLSLLCILTVPKNVRSLLLIQPKLVIPTISIL